MGLESAKGHGKNARNQLESLIVRKRRGIKVTQSDLQYALDEVSSTLDEIEDKQE